MAAVIGRRTFSATTTDSYARLDTLIGGAAFAIVEGVISFQTNGCTLVMQPSGSSPSSGTVGQEYPAGSFLGLGPAVRLDAGFRLDEMWVKSTSAGNASTVVFTGVIARGNS